MRKVKFKIGDIIVNKKGFIDDRLKYLGTNGHMYILENLIIEPGDGTSSMYYVNEDYLYNVYKLSDESILDKKLECLNEL